MGPEEWRAVPSIPRIEASSEGRVKRLSYTNSRGWKYPEKILKQSLAGKGYPSVGIGTPGTRHYVHRLVCEAFHGLAPLDSPIVLHRDDDKTNNKPSNLKWGTYHDNRVANQMMALTSGDNHWRRRLT